MRNDIRLNGWHISASGIVGDPFLESIFFTGNGRMGVRGYPALRPTARPVDTGLFIAGFFDVYKAGLTDFVNLPTPAWEAVKVNGQAVQPAGFALDLDLSCGKMTTTYHMDMAGAEISVTEERLFPLENPALLLQRSRFTCTAGAGSLTVDSGVELSCCNQPVPDDQVKQNDEQLCYIQADEPRFFAEGFAVDLKTKATGLTARYDTAFHPAGFEIKGPFSAEDAAGLRFTAQVKAGDALTLEKLTAITTGRDHDPMLAPLPASWSFDGLEQENKNLWAKKWEAASITIEGDADAQTAMRYVIYQLIVNCAARDDTVSIGARGLTHTRYKGCYFWDTDLFMLPFYLYTDPQSARSLSQFRVNTLPQAKAHAQKMNGTGARYPWMVAFDGTEQCETWDIGCSEIHVTADVAYALGQYMENTQDKGFFLSGGAEVLVETARFWISRYTPEPGTGLVNLLFCKGPDEYCGVTSNNLFTNMMVQHNLELAIRAADALARLDREQYHRLGITPGEQEDWARLHRSIKLPKDSASGHWQTDDTFHLLEPIDPKLLKTSDEASYHQVCFDRLQRYKVVKQADVLLLMTRLPERFSAVERLSAWEDFEPLCLHDSTLSFASHALFAAQNGLMERAEDYFRKALFLDLRDIMGNTGKEGLHMAGFGETWQTVVFGFAGLHFVNGKPHLEPHLPAGWTQLSFYFRYHGQQFFAEVGPNKTVCTPR